MKPQPHSPPQQRRSRRTLDRILTATERLLEDSLFEQLAMAQIAAEAGVAVGTLYTRFRAKPDLLPALFERHNDRAASEVQRLFSTLAETSDLSARIQKVVRFAVRYHSQNRGLLRALAHYVEAHSISVPSEVLQQREQQYGAIATAVAGEGAPRALQRDVLFGLRTVNAVCRDQILFAEVSAARSESDTPQKLERQLVRLLSSFLPEPQTRRRQ